ncbi:MAG: MFS transporter [Stellaceae bacterium]
MPNITLSDTTPVPAPEFGDASIAQKIASRLERIPISPWHVKIRIVVGVATFFDAFNALAIAYILPVIIPLWHIHSTDIGILISTAYVGQLVGALFFGWIAERFGRKPAIVWSILTFAVMSFACAGAWSYGSLVAFRILQGFGLGGEVPVAIAYISELSKAKGRGRFVLLYELIFPIGLLAAALLGLWIVPNFGWRWMFIIGGVPAVAAFFMTVIPESPRWLAARGRYAEAEVALTYIEQAAERSSGKALPSPEPTAAPEVKKASWGDLFGPGYLRRTLVIWFCWFASYLVTYGLVVWMPSLYRIVFHLPLQTALLYALIPNIVAIFTGLLCALVIDFTGRRWWFAGSLALCAVALLVLWAIGPTTPLRLLLFGGLAFLASGQLSLGLYLYTPELYPTRARAIAVGTATAWLRVASIIGPIFVGVMVGHGGFSLVFLGMGVVVALCAIVLAVFGVETKGRVLEEVSR